MEMEREAFFDWLTVGLWRRFEEKPHTATLDLLPAEESEIGENGRLTDPIRFLTRRADRLLSEKTGITSERIRFFYHLLVWIPVLSVLLLGILVFPLGKVRQILEGGELVNLAGPYFLFLGVQLFFLVVSLLALILTALVTFLAPLRGKCRTKENRVWTLCVGGLGSVSIFLTRRLGVWFDYCHGRRRQDNGKRSRYVNVFGDDVELNVWGNFFDLFLQHRRTLSFFAGICTHLFWLVLSTAVLFILVARMQSNRYDFCWKSSLGDRDQVEWIVERLGGPVSGWIPLPQGRDIDWLFENSVRFTSVIGGMTELGKKVETDVSNISPVEVSKIRRRWSVFLLALVFVYAVIPRLLLMVVYRALFLWSKRDFRPNLSDPYYSDLIARVEKGSRTVSEVIDDGRPADEPLSLPTTTAARSVFPQEQGKSISASISEASTSGVGEDRFKEIDSLSASVSAERERIGSGQAPSAGRVLTLGYDVEVKNLDWEWILGSDPSPIVFGNVTELRETKKKFHRWIVEEGRSISRTILLVDPSFPPAKQIRLWMQNDLFGLLPASRNYVIFSCGERLRRKFNGNPAAVEERLSEWIDILAQMSEALGCRVTPVTGYDHEMETAESRRRLRDYFQKERDGFGAGENQDSQSLQAEMTLNVSRDAVTESTSKREGETSTGSVSTDDSLFGRATEIVLTRSVDFLRESAGIGGSDEDLSRLVRDHLDQGYGELARLYRDGDISAKTSVEKGFFSFFHPDQKGITESGGNNPESSKTETGRDFSDRLRERLSVSGAAPKDFFDQVAAVSGWIDRASGFCRKLSPRSALLFGTAGLSLPLMAACAPLLGGGMTVTALLSTLGGMGAILPTALVSGSAGAAFGAAVPLSLSALRIKWRSVRLSRKTDSSHGRIVSDAKPEDDITTTAVLVIPLTVWALIFELQGTPEEEIAEILPNLLDPLDGMSLLGDTFHEATLDGTAPEKGTLDGAPSNGEKSLRAVLAEVEGRLTEWRDTREPQTKGETI